MFDIDYRGLAELEGGKPPHRLAYEPVANVFDEFRLGTTGDRRAPTASTVYAGAASLAEAAKDWEACPTCGGSGRRAKQSG